MSNIRINEIPLILDVDISEDDSFLFLDDETAETTRIKLSQLNNFIASSLTVTASNITNFTEDVRAQFTAGTNITIVDGVISSTAGGGSGDVTETGDNTFSGVNTFTTNYITASAGITGSTALFGSITGNLEATTVSASTYVNLPGLERVITNTDRSLLATERAIFVTNEVSSSITVTLPNAASAESREYHVIKADSNSGSVIIASQAPDLVNGSSNFGLNGPYQSVTLITDGTDWYVF